MRPAADRAYDAGRGRAKGAPKRSTDGRTSVRVDISNRLQLEDGTYALVVGDLLAGPLPTIGEMLRRRCGKDGRPTDAVVIGVMPDTVRPRIRLLLMTDTPSDQLPGSVLEAGAPVETAG